MADGAGSTVGKASTEACSAGGRHIPRPRPQQGQLPFGRYSPRDART